jgi:NAD(P)-dependent dehydrogenase (short-subunit alcohol dehydrogenase family)
MTPARSLRRVFGRMRSPQVSWRRHFAISQDATRLQQVAATPLGRIDTADEIAQATVFLASEASGFVIGQTLSPNGGNLMVSSSS